MPTLVLGGTGMVGRHVVNHLVAEGRQPYVLSRRPHDKTSGLEWIIGDLESPATIAFPWHHHVLCTVPPGFLVSAIPLLVAAGAERIAFLTSTSVVTKAASHEADERELARNLADIERQVTSMCAAFGIGWTILRPTLIYDEGRDSNVSRIARLVQKFGFFPLSGRGCGLRQPVHAEDVATGLLRAASSVAARNKVYDVPGGETLSYREMVGRIFDGLGQPRRIVSLPPPLWRAAFRVARHRLPHVNTAMADRMSKDMTFDASQAAQDFGWRPRPFHPRFERIK